MFWFLPGTVFDSSEEEAVSSVEDESDFILMISHGLVGACLLDFGDGVSDEDEDSDDECELLSFGLVYIHSKGVVVVTVVLCRVVEVYLLVNFITWGGFGWVFVAGPVVLVGNVERCMDSSSEVAWFCALANRVALVFPVAIVAKDQESSNPAPPLGMENAKLLSSSKVIS